LSYLPQNSLLKIVEIIQLNLPSKPVHLSKAKEAYWAHNLLQYAVRHLQSALSIQKL
jgi:hypothetical protein